ncbi:alpha/beta fold hydrolase [Cellulosimicrobium sp. SH8]|uniref:alpha/beta fold hydrolase n=1 Tax=Cellulosimicrobium sp. SH8 TaxID=2952936 RepID=UPI0021F2FF15|nr:alpha/beta hydrolase [Cellulosimicrobium sp. SH8]
MSHTIDFPGPTMVTVNGIELEVFEAGQENAGRPVVLCHGWPELAFSWRHQMAALAAAGYHVIAPNQRGFGGSSRPADVSDYDVVHLTGDLVGLLDHYGYEDATFVGHDWGANVVWSAAVLHPTRVRSVVALSVPYLERGEVPPLAFIEAAVGSDSYFVHFNRRPGVADALFDANAHRFLRNLYRKAEPEAEPASGTWLLDLAHAETPRGEPVLSDAELAVFVAAFEASGFTPGVNWYRNVDRNWELMTEVDPVVRQDALMIYGARDTVTRAPNLEAFVPRVEVVELDCGHWIQQELPEETSRLILAWLQRQEDAVRS